MRKIFFLSLILFSIPAYANGYLCIASSATGFVYNKALNKWIPGTFNVNNSKYIIKKVTKARMFGLPVKAKWIVETMGQSNAVAWSDKGFNSAGNLYLVMIGGHFLFNKISGRYLKSYTIGYVQKGLPNPMNHGKKWTDEDLDTPFLEIGVCSPL